LAVAHYHLGFLDNQIIFLHEKHWPMKSKKLIIFDMDGVIIDVSNSYRDTVRQTTKLFFSPAQHAELLPEPLFNLSDLAAVKHSGGLNNDWDLSFQTISLLFTHVEKPDICEARDPWPTYRKNLSRCHVIKLADYLNSTQKPLMTLLKQHGKISDPFVKEMSAAETSSNRFFRKSIWVKNFLNPHTTSHRKCTAVRAIF
jgi:hypothetical protein